MRRASSGAVAGGVRADEMVAAFVEVRARMLGIAYRVLGNVADAEDIVQEAWFRWNEVEKSTVRDVAAFLATVTTRLSINRAKSARARHEAIGVRSVEPVDDRADPCTDAERGEALEVATLMLLENLTPAERAAYVLREAFDYEYAQIAAIIRVTAVNCRQLVARARKHLTYGRRTPASPEDQQRLLDAFVDAAQAGELAALEELFATRLVFGRRWSVDSHSVTESTRARS